MAARVGKELRVELDPAALEQLNDFGEVLITIPWGNVDQIRVVHQEEDWERDMAESGQL